MASNGQGTLNVSTLEGWLWNAACVVRGPLDAPKFKDYILPLIFLKRLSDVFEDEIKRLAEELGDEDIALQIVEDDRTMVRFYIPPIARWPEIRQKTTGLGEHLTDAVRAVAKISELKPNEKKICKVLKTHFGDEGATSPEWQKACEEVEAVPKASFYRAKDNLVEGEHYFKEGDRFYPQAPQEVEEVAW